MNTCVEFVFGPPFANASVPRSSENSVGSSSNVRFSQSLCGERQFTPNCATNPVTTRETGVSS